MTIDQPGRHKCAVAVDPLLCVKRTGRICLRAGVDDPPVLRRDHRTIDQADAFEIGTHRSDLGIVPDPICQHIRLHRGSQVRRLDRACKARHR